MSEDEAFFALVSERQQERQQNRRTHPPPLPPKPAQFLVIKDEEPPSPSVQEDVSKSNSTLPREEKEKDKESPPIPTRDKSSSKVIQWMRKGNFRSSSAVNVASPQEGKKEKKLTFRHARLISTDEVTQLHTITNSRVVVTIVSAQVLNNNDNGNQGSLFKDFKEASQLGDIMHPEIVCKVEVKEGDNFRHIFRSYQHFKALHKKLETLFPSLAKEFPLPKHKDLKQDFSEEGGKRNLQNYFDNVICNEEVANSDLLREFIDPTHKPYLVPVGVINLEYCSVELSQAKMDFDIKVWGSRDLCFRCKDEIERSLWVVFLRALKKRNSVPQPKDEVIVKGPQFNQLLVDYAAGNYVPGSSLCDLSHAVNEYEEDSSANIVMSTHNSRQIKGATANKLLEKLTEEQQDIDFVACFLLTYRSFTTPQVLLHTCIHRFRSPPHKQLVEEQIHPTQLRVSTVLIKWIQTNFHDFVEDEHLTAELLDFIENEVIKNPKFTAMGLKLQNAIKKMVKPVTRERTSLTNEIPEPELPALFTTYINGFYFMDLSPLEIARQLCLLEFNTFSKIQAKECLNKKWEKKEAEAPNLTAVIRAFNQTSNWVVTEIVKTEDLTARAGILARFITIAHHCLQLNNYNSTMEILSGLNSSSVYRMHKTWAELPPSIMQTFTKMKEQLASSNNYRVYREILHTRPPPCVPFFGVYLTDLTFVDEGNSSLLETGLINFEKNYLFYKVIKEIKLYQQTEYTFKAVPEIQNYLLRLDVIDDENVAYKLSLKAEPRQE